MSAALRPCADCSHRLRNDMDDAAGAERLELARAKPWPTNEHCTLLLRHHYTTRPYTVHPELIQSRHSPDVWTLSAHGRSDSG